MNEVAIQNDEVKKYFDDTYTFLKIGESVYAFDAMHVLEIIKLVELEYPEKMPSYIAGILEYNMQIINVIDLRSILRIETGNYGVNTHIVIMQGKNGPFGIIADEIKDIKKIDKAFLAATPYSLNSCFTKAIYRDKGENVMVVNLDALEDWMKVADKAETNFSSKASSMLPRDIASKEILHQRKMQLIKKTKDPGYVTLKDKNVYISFLLNGNRYCLEIANVGGFYKFFETKIIKVPCTPNFVVGLMSVKGDYVTVIDLKKYLEPEFKTNINEKSTIIVLQSDEFKIGFVADEISDTLNITTDELFKNKPLKPEGKNEILEYVKDDVLYLVVNTKEILNNEKLYVG